MRLVSQKKKINEASLRKLFLFMLKKCIKWCSLKKIVFSKHAKLNGLEEVLFCVVIKLNLNTDPVYDPSYWVTGLTSGSSVKL